MTWRFPRHRRSVGRSRAELRGQLCSWGIIDDVVETAELLVSELLTNAVQHARVPKGREVAIHLTFDGSVLRIEVSDTSDELPKPRRAEENDESGTGLALVATFADDWGVCPRDVIGKTMWAALKLPGEAEA
ncbi:ATP-binding protein [Streptomyces sp. 8N616]|uniref:ATP-binding protein n=1 Tax=Streptomyces sp. 8N616 TaxID=3457414 RepID=UPI003FD0292E